MRSEVAQHAAFSRIRYAQCWEDADILLEALNIQPGFTCLSIASAGDNTLALLSKRPRKVLAIDLNPAQLAALELRVAAFRELRHPEMLALTGSIESQSRKELYERCRKHLSCTATRLIMGKLGRDPEHFRYVQGEVAAPLLERMRYAMTELDPAINPYLYWIFKGQHRDGALPFALRAENFEAIRANLDRLEWRCCTLQGFLESSPDEFDAFNLSDIFEYISVESYERLLRLLVRAAKPNARLAYWNLLVPRSRPESLAALLRPLKHLSDRLLARDKAFFYSAFVVEEVLCTSL